MTGHFTLETRFRTFRRVESYPFPSLYCKVRSIDPVLNLQTVTRSNHQIWGGRRLRVSHTGPGPKWLDLDSLVDERKDSVNVEVNGELMDRGRGVQRKSKGV